jgi:hypothetical protein
LREGAGDRAGALNDGELLSGRGSETVNQRAAQVSYTSPEINVPSNSQLIISVASSHAADIDVENRPSVKGHVAIGNQKTSDASAAPWRHGSIGRGNAADCAGAAKRSPGNIHQTTGSVTVYQQGPGVNRRDAGVSIRGVAKSQYASATFHHSASADHLPGPNGTKTAANVGTNASASWNKDAVVVIDPIEDEVAIDRRIIQRGERCHEGLCRIIRRDQPGRQRPGGVGDEATWVPAVDNKRGCATGCAIEGHLRDKICLVEPETAGVAVVARESHSSVDYANEGRTGDVTREIGGTGAGCAAALDAEWGVHRDITAECLRTSGVTQDTQPRHKRIAQRDPYVGQRSVIDNDVARDGRVCTRTRNAQGWRCTDHIHVIR